MLTVVLQHAGAWLAPISSRQQQQHRPVSGSRDQQQQLELTDDPGISAILSSHDNGAYAEGEQCEDEQYDQQHFAQQEGDPQEQQQQQQLEGLSDSQVDPDVVPGVETGEDVVGYYGVNGQDSPVKFFYCTRWATMPAILSARPIGHKQVLLQAAFYSIRYANLRTYQFSWQETGTEALVALCGGLLVRDGFFPLQKSSSHQTAIVLLGSEHINCGAYQTALLRLSCFDVCRAPEGTRFRPYDLLVVPRQSIGPEYFIMSATGVMHIRKGVQAEFTPLAEWVRERSMFDLITQISYFKHYLTGRAFRRWHRVSVHSRSCTALFHTLQVPLQQPSTTYM